MRLKLAGEGALILYLGETADDLTLARVQTATIAIEKAMGNELVDLVPSYASILIVFDPLLRSHIAVAHGVRGAIANLNTAAVTAGRAVTLPVLYSTEAGADLQTLADHAGLTIDDVIRLHSDTEYRAYAIGFAPGFAYLGQVDKRIAAPRLDTPRARVPRGSVAIADRLTAVYPAPSPGGWNLIGRCPLPLFQPHEDPAMRVSVGDRVQFEPIERERFIALGGLLP
ncbi:MAG: 5-oxoprolinase subunit PxpB [Halioglobus sp.]|nr:5-oxoprolinase subunit PxpB [Halioglobus sp.]